MTTAEWQDKAKELIEQYCSVPELVDAVVPYYANIIANMEDPDGLIMRGMVNAALDYGGIGLW